MGGAFHGFNSPFLLIQALAPEESSPGGGLRNGFSLPH